MAAGRMTLADFAKSKDAKGAQAQVIELMEQYNPALQDAPAYPADAPYGHRTVFRRSLPTVGTVKINKGVVRSKSSVDSRTDVMGAFSGRSEIDSRIKDLEGVDAFERKRRGEVVAFTESFAQLIAQTLFYGDIKTDEASFDGFAPRLNTLNAGASITTSQVWSMGSVSGSDGCSVYIIDWGENAAHLIFPPNTVAGLQISDKGEESVNDDAGNPYHAYVETFDQYIGLSVKDPRHIGRVPNIDLSDALLASPTQGVLLDKLEDVMDIMPEPGPNTRVLYCPPRLYTAFRRQARAKANLALTMEQYLGKLVPHLWGYPVRKMQQLTTAEATVS